MNDRPQLATTPASPEAFPPMPRLVNKFVPLQEDAPMFPHLEIVDAGLVRMGGQAPLF